MCPNPLLEIHAKEEPTEKSGGFFLPKNGWRMDRKEREMDIVNLKLSEIKPYENNPNIYASWAAGKVNTNAYGLHA